MAMYIVSNISFSSLKKLKQNNFMYLTHIYCSLYIFLICLSELKYANFLYKKGHHKIIIKRRRNKKKNQIHSFSEKMVISKKNRRNFLN